MIRIYVDPNDGNQVMRYFENSAPVDDSPLIDQGFVGIVIEDNHPQYDSLKQNQRDCRFDNDVVIERLNPIQPDHSREIAVRKAQLSADKKLSDIAGLTLDERLAKGYPA